MMNMQYIELAGVKHPLRMTLAAATKLSDIFGDLNRMGQALMGEDGGTGTAQAVDALDTVLTVLMDAGRVYAAYAGVKLPPPIPCKPSELIDARDGGALTAVLETMHGDTDREVEAVTKNGEATQGS